MHRKTDDLEMKKVKIVDRKENFNYVLSSLNVLLNKVFFMSLKKKGKDILSYCWHGLLIAFYLIDFLFFISLMEVFGTIFFITAEICA